MKNRKASLISITMLVAVLLTVGCSSTSTSTERKHPGVHKMGSMPMSDAKMPGKVPDSDR